MEHATCLSEEKRLSEGPRGGLATACSLQDIPDGVQATVLELRGCARVRSRLCSLGFTPGTPIAIYGKGVNGCRVQVRDTCIVLDCEIAENIICEFSSGGSTVAEACQCSCSS